MAQVVINIPDNIAIDVLDTLAIYYNYSIADGNKADFVKLKAFIEPALAIYNQAKADESEESFQATYVAPEIT